ncbi:hypothetical protein OJAV_G00106530 [Oryzias javanicus]|uniref:VPS9 domain-containing protein n=1 Tax=Oryzias javanicus TaxID=123683 RepID=A0A3S2M265_ORYJA|nr:hypothetical protein OJAV_G00106530 [Oryzias javanicus]
MMEASIVSRDAGLTSPQTGALESASILSSPLTTSSMPSQPPDRPSRPRPPTNTPKSSQLPSRPPLPASTPANLPSASMHSVSLSSNPPPPSLPPPLSPIVVFPSPQQSLSGPVPFASPPLTLPPPLSLTESASTCSLQSPPPGPVLPLSSPAPPVLSSIDKLVGSISIWQLEGLSQEKTTGILEQETAGMFLVHSTEGQATMISVRLPDEQGAPHIHNLVLKQHNKFIHLEGSSLVFDDICKLILFYCSSRDILTVLLRLPQAVTMTTQREELQVISAMQGRSAPFLPPAPLQCAPPRKQPDQNEGERTLKENSQNPLNETQKEQRGERGKGDAVERGGPPTEDPAQRASSQCEAEVNKDGGQQQQEGKMEDKEVKKVMEDKHLAKRPSRPVPPPRTKMVSSSSVASCSQAGWGAASSGMKIPPPQPARRPDVSLFSPQGGAAVGADPDSCDTSSTEEEGEPSQERGPNYKNITESHSPKAVLRRTPTTFMLHQARHLSAVVSGLISHDRRLTKRLVELARDPLSYFGNLVKEHRAFTLETMMKHMTSTELLQEIRQMMTQLKNYLLQSSELQAMLEPSQYTQDKLESIVEAALCKSVLKPLREPIYKTLEKLQVDAGSLKQLANNQSAILGSTTTALGITTSVPEAPAMEKISIKLNSLHQEYSPQRKIQLLLKTCKIIYDSMSVSHPGRAHGADDFLPVMMYVLARSNLSALQMDVEYMMELMDPTLTLGEGSYYLTTTYGALEHIKTFDQQRSATRQLSREVQDSIHRWERRRTLNQEQTGQGSVRDFLTVYCPAIGTNPKTMGIFPSMTMKQLAEQCATRFEQDSHILSVYMDGVRQPVSPTDLALSVKNGCQPGAYSFVFHPVHQRSCPTDPPPDPPAESLLTADVTANTEVEETLINL